MCCCTNYGKKDISAMPPANSAASPFIFAEHLGFVKIIGPYSAKSLREDKSLRDHGHGA
jgi:hypothetical protein